MCVDNAWSSLFGTQVNPPAGHWELRIDPSDTGDDCLGYGVRANDGDPSGGGVELPVYADSYLMFGPTTTAQQTNTFFPWVTAGCFARSNDFDTDGGNGEAANNSTFTLTGNVGFSQQFTGAGSGSGTWASHVSNNFTTDVSAQNYGIWTAAVTIFKNADANTAGNPVTYYLADPHAAVAGTGNPQNPRAAVGEAGAYRLYFPTDAGAAPVKPFVEQFVRYVSGPNPPAPNQPASIEAITIVVHNPTTRDITFSAANLVSATVPGGAVVYGGSPAVSGGTVVSQPTVGQAGTITWNPAIVAAGATALLTYNVRVTPAAAGARLLVTGASFTGGAATGTTATYVDETSGAQARAKFTFGPLCELAVTAGSLTYAAINDVRAVRDSDGATVLTWHTAGEVGTAAFSIFRVDGDERVPVGGLVPSVMSALGGAYAVRDSDAPRDGPLAYLIVEHDARGGAFESGPHVVLDDAADADAVDADDGVDASTQMRPTPYTTRVQALVDRLHDLLVASERPYATIASAPPLPPSSSSPLTPTASGALAALARPDHLDIRVDHDGLVAVPLALIAADLRVPASAVAGAVAANGAGLDLRAG
ncbi:MAG TPA: hypothetical protein VGO62_01070, partial [Myxococcota bacterium]